MGKDSIDVYELGELEDGMEIGGILVYALLVVGWWYRLGLFYKFNLLARYSL